jgi:polyisoprenoid-binding protein YceI
MLHRRLLALTLGLALSLTFGLPEASAAPPSYSIDQSHSRVGFKVRHKMVSWVAGQFDGFSGTIEFDPGDVESTRVKAEIDPASVNTSNPKRDGHLKGPDFFDVGAFPSLTFESTSVEKIAKDGSFTVVGNLTMHGVTKPAHLLFGPVSPLVGGKRGVAVTGSLNRQDFGISWSKLLDSGGLAVGNEILFDFNLELNAK